MPHNTAPAASATGTPVPIEGAGAPYQGRRRRSAQIGLAWATAAARTKNPLAKVNDLTPTLRHTYQILLNHDRSKLIATNHNVSISSSDFAAISLNSPLPMVNS